MTLVVGATACRRHDAATDPPPPSAVSARTAVPSAGSSMGGPAACDDAGAGGVRGGYSVAGLAATTHRPVLVYVDSNAWSGSPEGLPAATFYEDGLVVRATRGDGGSVSLVQGTAADTAGLARRIGAALAEVPVRVTVSRATDQPEVVIATRVGEAWRAVTVVGLHPDDSVVAPSNPVPKAFVDARHELRALPLAGEHPLARDTFRVTLTDDSVPSSTAIPWPAGVPAPPKLVPDTRWVGNPRSYVAHGESGRALYAATHLPAGRPTMTTPSGERVEVWATVMIPDQDYVEHVTHCAPWDEEPFGPCAR